MAGGWAAKVSSGIGREEENKAAEGLWRMSWMLVLHPVAGDGA